MNWLQQNWLTVFMLIVIVALIFKGPILSAIFDIKNIDSHKLVDMLKSPKPPLLLDVRTPAEFNEGHIAQAVLVPVGQLGGRVEQLRSNNPDRPVAVICASGARSMMASVTLKRAGFEEVYNISNGMIHWQGQGYPVTK